MVDQNVNMEDVIRKIQKLDAFAKNAAEKGNEAEAQTYAAMMHKLLLQHKLTMAHIGQQQKADEDPIRENFVNWSAHGIPYRSKRVGWMEDLAQLVSHAYGCSILVISSSSNIVIVGRESSAKIAEYTIATLIRAAERIAQKSYDTFYNECYTQGMPWRAKGYKNSFLIGFCRRIGQRLDDEIRKAQTETVNSMAIVLVKNDSKAVAEFIENLAGVKKSDALRRRNGNQAGFADGVAAANNIDLKGKAFEGEEASSSDSQKKLG